MISRLSFAQILQKKQPIDQSQNSNFFSSQESSQTNNKYLQETTSLAEMMEEYLQYQEAPESNFILSFAEDNLNIRGEDQDFVSGQNPLDSWIMSQKNFNTNQTSISKQSNFGSNNGKSMMEMSKKYAKAKENNNAVYGNDGNDEFKFSSRAYERSTENLQRMEDSHRQKNPSFHNKLMKNVSIIEGTEFIQSQACGYAEVIPSPNNTSETLIKKVEEEEENLMTGIDNESSNNNKQKRIEDAREQIKEYLKLKGKSTDTSNTSSIKNFQFFKKEEARVEESEIEKAKVSLTNVNYSFAQYQDQLENKDSFPNTKQSIIQINEGNRTRENEKMLSCIEYAQSEADEEEHANQIIHPKCDQNYWNYRKLEVSQSIPEKKERVGCVEPSTLEKYIPTSGSIEELSEVVEKIYVQPSIVENMTSKDGDSMNFKNSDHPRLKEFCSGEIFKDMIELQEIPPVFHDVSSIDIQISEEISNVKIEIESPEPSKEFEQINTNCAQVPMLNIKISDISSVSNQSNIESAHLPLKGPLISSPKEYSNNKEISQVEYGQPVSSHENINLRAHTEGFIYAMKINSRNSSFTSDINVNRHGKPGSFNSLHPKDSVNNLIGDNYSNIGNESMNKNDRKIVEFEVDLEKEIKQKIEDPEKEEENGRKEEGKKEIELVVMENNNITSPKIEKPIYCSTKSEIKQIKFEEEAGRCNPLEEKYEMKEVDKENYKKNETENLVKYQNDSLYVQTQVQIAVAKEEKRKDEEPIGNGGLRKVTEASESFRFDLDF